LGVPRKGVEHFGGAGDACPSDPKLGGEVVLQLGGVLDPVRQRAVGPRPPDVFAWLRPTTGGLVA